MGRWGTIFPARKVPAVGPWIEYTPVVANGGSLTYNEQKAWYRIIGENAQFRYSARISGGTGAGSAYGVDLATGFTLDTTKMIGTGFGTRDAVGEGSWYNSSGTDHNDTSIYMSNTTRMTIISTSSGAPLLGNELAAGDELFILTHPLPIVELEGQGTSDIGVNEVEYVSNSDTSDADDSTSFVTGSAGSLVPGNLTAARKKRVRFSTPILPTDVLDIHFDMEGNGQFCEPPTARSTDGRVVTRYDGANAGVYLQRVSGSTTEIDVFFQRYRVGTGNWSEVSTAKWRVVKHSAGIPNNFGRASGAAPGLVSRESGEAVSASIGNINESVNLTGDIYRTGNNVTLRIDTMAQVTKNGVGSITVSGFVPSFYRPPSAVSFFLQAYVSASTYFNISCAIDSDGDLEIWSNEQRGNYGNGQELQFFTQNSLSWIVD